MDVKSLQAAIHNIARLEAPSVAPQVHALIAQDLAEFVFSAIKKFENGQKEHGGNITDRDLNLEISQEITDLFFYTRAQKWPRYLMPQTPKKK